MVTENQILDALKTIVDPDFNQDIVSLGFIENLTTNNGDVSFDIALTTPACPIKDEFKRKAEESVRALDNVTSVSVNMTSKPGKRAQSASTQNVPSLNNIGAIIGVSSCKGGVGKSTIAAHMAMELAHRGYSVGLLDADIYGPSIPHLFNVQNPKLESNTEKKIKPIEKNGLKLLSFGFLLGDAPAIMRGPIVTRYLQQVLFQCDWGTLDYLFIDLPPGTGDIHITITQSLRLDGAVIVTTPHSLSLIDVARGILMFEKVSVPILGVLENMSYFQDEASDKKHFVFGEQGSSQIVERFGVDLLGEIPILPQLTQTCERYVGNQFVMDTVDKTIRSLGKKSHQTKNIPNVYADKKKITLQWPDGKKQIVSNFDLRLNSQDALSVDEMTGRSKLRPEDIRKDIAAKKITPLGNYAIGVEWNDGHTAGIYPYNLINKLASN